jgi:hypothetical protein
LTEEIKENDQALKNLIQIFFALGIEFRAGRISESDLGGRTNDLNWRGFGEKSSELKPIQITSDRYVGTHLGGQILTDEVLVNTLARGVFDIEIIVQTIKSSEYFKNIADQAPWRRVWWGHSMSEADFEKAVDEMEAQFADGSITDPVELLHVFGLRLWLSDIGAISQTLDEVRDEGSKYVDALYAAKKLEPVEPEFLGFARRGGSGGLSIQSQDKAQYKELFTYLREAQVRVAIENRPAKAAALLTEMRDDVAKFAFHISQDYGDGSTYANVPLLISIDPHEFVQVLATLEPPAIDTVFGALRSRYQFGKLDGVLKEETDWLKDLIERVREVAPSVRPLKRHLLTEMSQGLFNATFGDESE